MSTVSSSAGASQKVASYGHSPVLAVTAFGEAGILFSRTMDLSHSAPYRIGSSPECEMRISHISPVHCFLDVHGGQCILTNNPSSAGTYYNNQLQTSCLVSDGDLFKLGNATPIVLAFNNPDAKWTNLDISRLSHVTIGRAYDMNLPLSHDSVGLHAADLTRDGQGVWRLVPQDAGTGIFIDNVRIRDACALSPGMHIMIGRVSFLFFSNTLFVMTARQGVDVQADNLVRYRGRGKKKKITNDHINLHIRRGEFVAIIGGSGSGKSTLLNELNGSEPADEGSVYVDGVDFYENYDVLRSTVGYVPQKDIVHDNLTVQQTLKKAAELRMSADSTPEDHDRRINEVLALLSLEEFRSNRVTNLSGGQRKRVSIAVALLNDPHLLYLDEPTSGLDPSLDRELMMNLAKMAQGGRTIVLITHTPANLMLCDRVVILGRGGKLCYFGPPAFAADFFGVRQIADIYEKIDKEPVVWANKYIDHVSRLAPEPVSLRVKNLEAESVKFPFFKQLRVLSSRYLRLIVNDTSRLTLLFLQAPILAALIAWVTGDNAFELFENTRSSLFALSCAAFWVGILNSIQEICKETEIFKREYEGGVRIESYIASKVVVLSALSIFQSALITIVYCWMIPLTHSDGWTLPFQIFIAVSLITLSAMALGLAVSALFTNPDRAIAMAPLLIMPQILFSGIVVELKGAIDTISKVIFCRWGMQALGASADVNAMDLALYGTELDIEGLPEPVVLDAEMGLPRSDSDLQMFDPVLSNIISSWAVLLLLTLACIAIAFVVLRLRVRRK